MTEFSLVFLDHENWPEWFVLDFAPPTTPKGASNILIGIAEAPLRWFCKNIRRHAALEQHEKLLRQYEIEPKFSLDVTKSWGFGQTLKPRGHADGFALYSVEIPQIEKDAGACPECKGKNTGRLRNCLYCVGTGRKIELDWEKLDRVAASICLLSNVILDSPEKSSLAGARSRHNQLLSVRMFFGREYPFIGAVLAQPFGDYLRSIAERDLPEVKAAAKSAYFRMLPSRVRFGDYSFRAHVHAKGQLIIDVPGDACGIYVDGMADFLKETSGPAELDCHNIDGHHQQLALFAGLAALAGIARRALYPPP